MSPDSRSEARPRRRDDACGVILYDKPAGITSHDAVARTRRRFGAAVGAERAGHGPPAGRPRRAVRVGHAGTLDPFATGLLLILVGRATRVQRFLMALPKRYVAVARFGARSSTGDPEGEIVETGVVPAGDLELPTGTIRQRAPAYSAVKVAGRRAYALARAGETDVVLPEREVEVYRFEELRREGSRRVFEIECSSGTYVRKLIAELGDAYCEELRRTAIGRFEIGDADPERVIPLNDALSFLAEVRLDAEHARIACHGNAVPVPGAQEGTVEAVAGAAEGVAGAAEGVAGAAEGVAGAAEGVAGAPAVRLVDDAGLIALAEPREGGRVLKPVVGLRG